MQSMLKVAMVNSESAQHGGISRVVQELTTRWDLQILRCEAQLTSPSLPVVRSYPTRCHVPPGTDLVYLPRTSGTTALKRLGLPSVVTVHDVGFWDCEADARVLGWRKVLVIPDFKSLRWASRVVVDSHFTGARLGLLIPDIQDRIRVIHLGVSDVFLNWDWDRERSRKMAQSQFPELTGGPLLIYTGDDAPRKNLPVLLAAFRDVKRQHPSAQLIKVGRAKLAADRECTLQVLKALGLDAGRDVLFYGDIDDLALACLYRASDAFVSTSLYEGFGLPPLEALAVGTPAVVTNRGAFPEIVGNAAHVVEPTRDAITKAVLQVLRGNAGHTDSALLKSFARRYSWDRAAQQYMDVFQDAVHGNRAPSRERSVSGRYRTL